MSHRFSITVIAACSVTAIGCAKDDNPRTTSVNTHHIEPAIPVVPSPNDVAVGHHTEHQTVTGAGIGAGASATSALAARSGPFLEADAEFKSVPGMNIKGDAELEEIAGGVRIKIEVENAPVGQKGIHIHETDDCSDIANKSMGEHFAPNTPKHGLPNHPEHHLGDLGNITIGKGGEGELTITVMNANLKANDPLSFVGRSIVLHESVDKGTGPSGDSGKPVACAPIRAD